MDEFTYSKKLSSYIKSLTLALGYLKIYWPETKKLKPTIKTPISYQPTIILKQVLHRINKNIAQKI